MELNKLIKNIKIACSAGFCRGVRRAVETAKQIKIKNHNKKVWILGELIHNTEVINELERLGIHTVNSLESCEKGICIIRSHGMAQNKIEKIKNDGFEIVDLTCPDVKKVQEKAILLAKENFPVLILGKSEHPEVSAIKENTLQYTDKVFVISSIEELSQILDFIKKEKKAGIVVQTTQKADFLQEIVSELLLVTKELKVFNTICNATVIRQNEALEIARSSDLMIVIGGKNSANTTHLAEILSEITKCIHIEKKSDLDKYLKELNEAENIGITAGASTPENLIKEIVKKINEI